MKRTSFYILRIGVAITFLWIGFLILKSPDSWATLIQPWAAKLIPGSLRSAMIGTGILDLAVGFFMLIGVWTWLAAVLGAIHIVTVLITTGISMITVRDIGLLAATITLTLDSLPATIARWPIIRNLTGSGNGMVS